ncbi:MAG: hypothetical protein WCT31_00555 [Candidatus Micrarchaeia archaeon]|jgi:hypothetical protein
MTHKSSSIGRKLAVGAIAVVAAFGLAKCAGPDVPETYRGKEITQANRAEILQIEPARLDGGARAGKILECERTESCVTRLPTDQERKEFGLGNGFVDFGRGVIEPGNSKPVDDATGGRIGGGGARVEVGDGLFVTSVSETGNEAAKLTPTTFLMGGRRYGLDQGELGAIVVGDKIEFEDGATIEISSKNLNGTMLRVTHTETDDMGTLTTQTSLTYARYDELTKTGIGYSVLATLNPSGTLSVSVTRTDPIEDVQWKPGQQPKEGAKPTSVRASGTLDCNPNETGANRCWRD